MVYYRLYLLDPANGRFVGFEEIEAPDDVEAVQRASSHVGNQLLELWCGERKVKSFPAEPGTGPGGSEGGEAARQ